MKTHAENARFFPKHSLPKAAGKPIHKLLAVAVYTIIAAFVVNSAASAPISCYMRTDGVTSRTPRACAKPADIPNIFTALPITGAMTATPAASGMWPDTLTFKLGPFWDYADDSNDRFSVDAAAIKTGSNPALHAISGNQPIPSCCPSSLSADMGISASGQQGRWLANGQDSQMITMAPVFMVVVFAIAVCSIQSLGRRGE